MDALIMSESVASIEIIEAVNQSMVVQRNDRNRGLYFSHVLYDGCL